eukprot:TRINITY_DN1816_c0_g2_i1.p1 TRINITY_DN1816_c0_g2~~TRINITY_DN1816_c0_g2_i1.p1  ORF type:complete len:808 (+),score=106.91 TRINITY_DN1816_c0_g2_i1:2-2425(+)
MTCYCGKTARQGRCGTGDLYLVPDNNEENRKRYFSCDQECGKLLSCGEHKCQARCHKGPCASCVLMPENVLYCPCGKMILETFLEKPRTKCTDPIPTCTNKCNKLLNCKIHRCPETCHTGDCPECLTGSQKIKCRCGRRGKKFKCSEVVEFYTKYPGAKVSGYTPGVEPLFSCEKLCKAQRSCKRHPCGIKCCPKTRAAHLCHNICGKLLKCGKHYCNELCHASKCKRCTVRSVEELTCSCGKTVLYPPITCGTPPPNCNYFCGRASTCGHKVVQHKCHTDKVPCPPCTQLVERWCMGKHVLRQNIMCHLSDISCGKRCLKMMPCGEHKCQRYCHKGKCVVSPKKKPKKLQVKTVEKEEEEEERAEEEEEESNNEAKAKEKEAEDSTPSSCNQQCLRPLSGCEHKCKALCHPGTPCPDIPCNSITDVYCPCKRIKAHHVCFNVAKNQLECNSECAKQKRIKAFALAIEKRREAEDLERKHGTRKDGAEYFPLSLIVSASKKPEFADYVENELLKLFETDNTRSFKENQIKFPIMEVEQREFVHALAAVYGLESKSFNKLDISDAPGEFANCPTTTIRRYVIVRIRSDFWDSDNPRLPPVRLSVLAKEHAEKERTGWADWGCVMKIYELTKAVRTEQLEEFLSAYADQYHLKWVDDNNALVFFSTTKKRDEAVELLQKGTPAYKVKKVESQSELDGQSTYISIPSPWVRNAMAGGLLKNNPLLRKTGQRETSVVRPKEPEKTKVSNPWTALQLPHATASPRDSWQSLDDGEDAETEEGEVTPLQWSCSACTFLNDMTRTHCEICNARK